MSLDRDELQQHRHLSRKLAEMAEIQWQALQRTDIPDELAREMMLAWWTSSMAPRMEFPDLSALFRQDD